MYGTAGPHGGDGFLVETTGLIFRKIPLGVKWCLSIFLSLYFVAEAAAFRMFQ